MTGTPVSPYRDARVMVLGAGGFIGRWVARLLAEQGALVELVVRDGRRVETLRRTWAVDGPVLTADLDASTVGDLVGAVRPAVVFNLAGYGVDPSERDAASARRLNTDLPPALAVAMAVGGDRHWSGQQVVHAGSALEYGTASGDLQEQTPSFPTTLYGRTKLEGTQRLHEVAARVGARAVTGRLFTVYGPGEGDGRLLPTLLDASRSGRPIPLTAGLQRRDFTFVADAAEGLLRLGILPTSSCHPVNIATGRLETVRGFVETAAKILGIESGRLQFGAIETRAEEMQHDPVNIDRLRALTRWSPATTIADGVARTAAFGGGAASSGS